MRRGGNTLIVGGPPETYGPLAGPQWVRDSCTPQAVVHPGGSPTVVTPADDVAAKITAAGTGGVLWFTKGTYNRFSAANPIAGQTWYLESAAGYARSSADSVVFDGGGNNLTTLIGSGGVGVTIKGGVLQNAGDVNSPVFAGGILATGATWTLQDIIVKNNFNNGIETQGSNTTIKRCYCTNNGRYGITCNFNGTSDATGTLLESNRISFNNARGLDPGGDSSATKFTHQPGITCRYNWVHDNKGFGIWADFAGNDIVGGQFIENVSEHNSRAGIFQEGTDGGNVYRNYLLNNGYDTATYVTNTPTFENCVQIRITNADSSQGPSRGNVERNLIDYTLGQSGNQGGAILLWNHDGHPDLVKNWDIHHNQIWLRQSVTQRVGGLDNAVFSLFQVWDGDNDFFSNEYHVANGQENIAYWKWDSGTGQGVSKTYTGANQWQSFHPSDNLPLVVI
jgi:hypothetical protein